MAVREKSKTRFNYLHRISDRFFPTNGIDNSLMNACRVNVRKLVIAAVTSGNEIDNSLMNACRVNVRKLVIAAVTSGNGIDNSLMNACRVNVQQPSNQRHRPRFKK